MTVPQMEIIFPDVDWRGAMRRYDIRLDPMKDIRDGFVFEIIQLIRGRIEDEGRDATGRSGAPFTLYSAAYAAAKGSGKVDLTLSGFMLNQIAGIFRTKTATTPSFIEINFASADAEERMGFHQFGTKAGMPVRAGFGLTEEEQQFIFLAMEQVWDTQTTEAAEEATGLPRA